MSHDEILNRALDKAKAGRATEMTPREMDAYRVWSEAKSTTHVDAIHRKQEQARRTFSETERDVWSFVRREFNKAAATEGYDPDKHDDPVLERAAERFNITKEEVNRIYVELDGAGLDLK